MLGFWDAEKLVFPLPKGQVSSLIVSLFSLPPKSAYFWDFWYFYCCLILQEQYVYVLVCWAYCNLRGLVEMLGHPTSDTGTGWAPLHNPILKAFT